MEKNTAFVRFVIPQDLAPGDFFRAVVDALVRGLPHDARLTHVVAQDAFVLDQGETVEIVPAAAAAGEVGIAETVLPLEEEQLKKAKFHINLRLRYPIKEVVGATVCRRTNTILAWCQHHNRDFGWVTVMLSPKGIDHILE